MGYDKEKRNLYLRSLRFLKKYGIEKTGSGEDSGFFLPVDQQHDLVLFGKKYGFRERPIPLGRSPRAAIMALQGITLLVLDALPDSQWILDWAFHYGTRKQTETLLYRVGLMKQVLPGVMTPVALASGGSAPVLSGRDVTWILLLEENARESELVEQYMYLR